VADPLSPDFGKPYTDQEKVAAGAHQGNRCLVKEGDHVVMLELVQCRETFITRAQKRLHLMAGSGAGESSPLSHMLSSFLGAAGHLKERVEAVSHSASESIKEAKEATATAAASIRETVEAVGHGDRRLQLGQLDIFLHRPAFVHRRMFYGLTAVVLYAGCVVRSVEIDTPPSIAVPIVASFAYPSVLWMLSRAMQHRMPTQQYVFELLLAFDLYQLICETFIFVGFCVEAQRLGLLVPPWGNPMEVSSPMLRALLWLHYHNRVLELLDTVFRLTQKRFHSYGAIHVWLRLLAVWTWFAVCRVGGGDTYFHGMLNAGVSALRYLVFTLGLLRWNWNFKVDFGLYAPKMQVFRKEHLYAIQVGQCALLALHALCAFWWGNAPRPLAVLQFVMMFSGVIFFTNYEYLRDAKDLSAVPGNRRVVFSFDSTGWLYMYHLGVAMWIQDNLNLESKEVAFSGSSGGGLTAAALASGIDTGEIAQRMVKFFNEIGWNAFRILPNVDKTLDDILPQDAHERCSGGIRVLLTKVSMKPPFFQAEAASQFRTWKELFCCLRATCHIPMIGGILPYPVEGRGWYYDGLLWASLFVPWRSFAETDQVIKVSGLGLPGAHIGPRQPAPAWWGLFPPSKEALEGLVWSGYRDTARFFETDLSDGPGVGCCRGRRPPGERGAKADAARRLDGPELLAKLGKSERCSRWDTDKADLVRKLDSMAATSWVAGVAGMAGLALTAAGALLVKYG